MSVPAAVPAAALRRLSQRGSSDTSEQEDALYVVLEQKLRTKWFFSLKNAFSAFDPQQKGSVTREALYRILCNSLGGVTRRQFAQLLDRFGLGTSLLRAQYYVHSPCRLHLSRKQQISFWEFLGRFQLRPSSSSHWMDPLSRHGPRPLTAKQVHFMLQERARKWLVPLSDL